MKFSKKSTLLLSFVFLGLSVLLGLSPVWAISSGTLGVQPANPDPTQPFGKSWFIYTVEIGQKIKDQVEVINLSNESVRARVWAADAATTPDGAYTIKEEKTDIGTWVTFSGKEERILDLKAGETKTVGFILEVPEKAEVGDHMGAVMAQAIETPGELVGEGAEVGSGVKVVTRVGARVYLTVSGEIVRALEFPEFSWERRDNSFYFVLTLKNRGNVRIEPEGEILIKSILGTKIDEIKIPAREVFPKDEIILPVEWKKVPFWARYGGFTAEAKITYGPGLELTKELRASTLPWYVPVLLGGILLAIVLPKKLKKSVVRRGRAVGRVVIETIVLKAGAGWRKLVETSRKGKKM